MLLKPNIKLDRITEISYKMLEKRGINALILDVDNTLSTHHGMKLCDGLEEWLDEMRSKGVKLLILRIFFHIVPDFVVHREPSFSLCVSSHCCSITDAATLSTTCFRPLRERPPSSRASSAVTVERRSS